MCEIEQMNLIFSCLLGLVLGDTQSLVNAGFRMAVQLVYFHHLQECSGCPVTLATPAQALKRPIDPIIKRLPILMQSQAPRQGLKGLSPTSGFFCGYCRENLGLPPHLAFSVGTVEST